MKKMRTFDEYVTQEFRNDPKLAYEYLNVAYEAYQKERDPKIFLNAIRKVAAARGGITKLATQTKLNRQGLYRSLSSHGNPTLTTLTTVLDALGMQFSIIPLHRHSSSHGYTLSAAKCSSHRLNEKS